jgi:integrase/recombinase XerD
LFLNAHAPFADLSVHGVKGVVRTAGARAGLGSLGAHRLRHTTATQLLGSGASLAEVGQVLRHRCLVTTAIYAKVDRIALRDLAQPWPGVIA